MDIQQLTTSSCETRYHVDGHKVRLWIVSGGQDSILSLDDFCFSTRFPCTDKRWQVPHDTWMEHLCYPHQDIHNIQGPTFDVLPEGRKTMEDFVRWAVPLRDLRMDRFNQLPVHREVVSTRIHDKENREYVRVHLCIDTHWLHSVLADSRSSSGRLDDDIRAMAHPWWGKYDDFIQPLIKSGTDTLEKLTQEQFLQMKALLEEGLSSHACSED